MNKEQKILDNLWREITEIETVTIMIPVDYNPNPRRITIPQEDNTGKVYTVISVPIEHIEKIFQKHFTPAKQGKE